MKKLIRFLRNKYLLATAAFIAWMLFFDHNDFFSQYGYYKQLLALEEEKNFYVRETNQVKADFNALTTDPKHLEKFAREKYIMKKDDEDVYVVIFEAEDSKAN